MSLSPLHPGLIPSLVHQGQAFPIHGMSEYEATVGAAGRWALFFTNTGRSGTIGTALSWAKTGGSSPAINQRMFTLPLLASADDAGGPTSARAMKIGVDVLTNTQVLNRGGAIYVLNSDQRILFPNAPSVMTSTEWNTFWDSVTSHPRRNKLDLCHFDPAQHYYGHVVDDPAYNNFDEFHGTYSLDEFLKHVGLWPGTSPLDRPMSTIIILIDAPATTQVVSFTARASLYTRWTLNTVPGQAQKDIPTASSETLNGINRSAIQHAHSIIHSAANAIGQVALNRAAGIPGAAMRALVNRYGGMGRGPRALLDR